MCKYCDSKVIDRIIEIANDKAKNGDDIDFNEAWAFQKAVEESGIFTFFDSYGQINVLFGNGDIVYFEHNASYDIHHVQGIPYCKERFKYCPACGRKLD